MAARSCFDAKKMKKEILLTWTSEIIQFIRIEMHMDRPDKFENIFGISYKLSKHLTFYASPLISHLKGLKTNICLFSAPSIEHNAGAK